MTTTKITLTTGQAPKQVQTGLRIDADLYDVLRAEAIRERLPVARVVNRIIADHFRCSGQRAA